MEVWREGGRKGRRGGMEGESVEGGRADNVWREGGGERREVWKGEEGRGGGRGFRKRSYLYITKMTSKDSDGLDMICAPHANGSVT